MADGPVTQASTPRISEAQGRIEEPCRATPDVPAAGPPLRGSALLTSPSRPGHHAASTETHSGGLAKQGLALRLQERLPWTLVLSLLPALDRHFHQGHLRGGRPRPSAALTAGPFHTTVLALPVYCHRGRKSPGMPPWSSGFRAYAPCPHCRGTPSSSG